MLDLTKLKEGLTPSKKEEKEIERKVSIILKKIQKNLKEATIILGGSYAKGTWLKDKHDIDLFAQFKTEKNISNTLERGLKKTFKNLERIHGSRDYFHIQEKNLEIEIVPVLKIKNPEEAKNITDISPLHVHFVRIHTNEDLRNEIRLAKQFFTAQNLYGAETYIKGFSGYAVELLIIYYGSFFNLIKSMRTWETGDYLYFKKKEKLNPSKEGSLNFLDPVQEDRNAAAALSHEKFMKAKQAAEEFYKNPRKEMFKEKGVSKKEIFNYTIILEAIPVKGSKDVTRTKVLKVKERIEQELNQEGFTVKKAGWHWEEEKAYLYYECKEKLEGLKTVEGPPIIKKEHMEEFKKKHKSIFIKKGKIYAREKRKYKEVKLFLQRVLKEAEIKKRIKKISLI